MPAEAQWSDYIGRSQESEIMISRDHIRGLAALLDYPQPPWPPGQVPPTGQWCTIFPPAQQSKLGHDGHEALGEFMPPLRYPRRMWAGGRLRYIHTLLVGKAYTHRTTIQDIRDKQGSSGPMTFVTLCHEYFDGDILMLVDEQDIVYRDISTAPLNKPSISASEQPAHACDWSRTIIPDTTLLFRYSAVSFNSHRIHYDQAYAHGEGYPGLLVHAPLTATLLIDLFQRNNPGKNILAAEYAARSPLYEGYPFSIFGQRKENGRVMLWAEDCEGQRSMSVELETDITSTGA